MVLKSLQVPDDLSEEKEDRGTTQVERDLERRKK